MVSKLKYWLYVALGVPVSRSGGLGQDLDSRFAIFGAQDEHSIMPRMDVPTIEGGWTGPISPERRLEPTAPLVAAYLGGRPVVLARPEYKTWRPGSGVPADLTIPVTLSRFRRALDIEADRATMAYEPSLIDDWPATHLPYG